MVMPTAHSLVGTRLSVMMFIQFFIWGAWYVTVGNYMAAHGMSDGIFWAYTVGPIAAIISPFFLGMIADRFFATERVLGVMHLIGGTAMLAAPSVAQQQGETFWPFIGVLAIHMLCYMPTLGLTNTLAFHNMTNQEKQFPLIRVFGTIGWIVANVVVSKILHADATDVQFYVVGGACLALGLFSFTLPHTPAPAAGTTATLHDILGLDSLALMKQPSFAIFVISSFLICIPLAAYYNYAPVFAKAMGFEDPAFNMSFGQMSEIFFMLVMPLCFVRLGVKWMLAIGMLAWVTRYGLFSAAADEHVGWMVLAGILLHGICYDFFFVTGQIYVDKKASREIRGQAQGFLVLITQGLGMLLGAQIFGRIVNTYTQAQGDIRVGDWQTVWLIPCIAALIVLIWFIALFREKHSPPLPTPRAETFAAP
jgi:nucleoside transporter